MMITVRRGRKGRRYQTNKPIDPLSEATRICLESLTTSWKDTTYDVAFCMIDLVSNCCIVNLHLHILMHHSSSSAVVESWILASNSYSSAFAIGENRCMLQHLYIGVVHHLLNLTPSTLSLLGIALHQSTAPLGNCEEDKVIDRYGCKWWCHYWG